MLLKERQIIPLSSSDLRVLFCEYPAEEEHKIHVAEDADTFHSQVCELVGGEGTEALTPC